MEPCRGRRLRGPVRGARVVGRNGSRWPFRAVSPPGTGTHASAVGSCRRTTQPSAGMRAAFARARTMSRSLPVALTALRFLTVLGTADASCMAASFMCRPLPKKRFSTIGRHPWYIPQNLAHASHVRSSWTRHCPVLAHASPGNATRARSDPARPPCAMHMVSSCAWSQPTVISY